MGTSGLKCVAVDPETKEQYSVYSEWTLLTPQAGYAEFDCHELWQHIIGCIKQMEAEHGVSPDSIGAIGFCALCPGLIAMDENGQEISRCIIFMDARSGRETEYILSVLPVEKSFPIIANRIMSGATSITSILWLKNHMPDVYAATKHFVHLPSWAGYKLTGKLVMDYSNAAGTGLYDIHRQTWSEEIAETVGIDINKFPPLASATELLGGVNNPELIALGIAPGTPVSCGAGDTVCALFGLGISERSAMLSLGTSHVLYTLSSRDRFSDALMVRSYVLRDIWAVGGAMSNPGAMLRWYRDKFCRDLAEEAARKGMDPYELMDEEARNVPPGSHGLICLPYINGERTPVYDSDVRAIFFGAGFDCGRAEFFRAIMEGAAYGIRQILSMLEDCLGNHIDSIIATGGGSKSDVLLQIFANITGRSIFVSNAHDIGAVGAGLTAAVASGWLSTEKLPACGVIVKIFEPNPDTREVYDRGYQKYLRLYPSTRDIFRM